MEINYEQYKPRKSIFDYTYTADKNIVASNGKLLLAKELDGIYLSQDAGANWTKTQYSGLPSVATSFLLKSNVILIFTTDRIYRSTDVGVSFTQITYASYSGNYAPYYHGVDFNPGNSDIIYAEYQTDGLHTPLNIFRSTDNGYSWSSKLTQPVVTDSTGIRHFHTIHYNNNNGYWYATSGDINVNTKWWSSPDGVTWTQIVDGSTVTRNPQIWRTVNMVFTENNEVIWMSDDYQNQDSGIYKADLNDIPNSVLKPTLLCNCSGTGYGIAKDGNTIMAVSKYEGNNLHRGGFVHLSQDGGNTWDVDAVFDSDGSSSCGLGRITGPDSKGRFYFLVIGIAGMLGTDKVGMMASKDL